MHWLCAFLIPYFTTYISVLTAALHTYTHTHNLSSPSALGFITPSLLRGVNTSERAQSPNRGDLTTLFSDLKPETLPSQL